MFLLYFQDLGILSRISLNKNWTLKLSQKSSELINYLFSYLNSFFPTWYVITNNRIRSASVKYFSLQRGLEGDV